MEKNVYRFLFKNDDYDEGTAIRIPVVPGAENEPVDLSVSEKETADVELEEKLEKIDAELGHLMGSLDRKELFDKKVLSDEKLTAGKQLLDLLNKKWEELIDRYLQRKEKTMQLLAEFESCKKELEDFLKDVEDWKKGDRIGRERHKNSFNRCVDFIDKTKEERIRKKKEGENVSSLNIEYFKTTGLSEDEINELKKHIASANEEIKETKRDEEIIRKKAETKRIENEFEKAIQGIKDVSIEEYESLYVAKGNAGELKLDGDFRIEIKKHLDLYLQHEKDASVELPEKWDEKWAQLNFQVKALNSPDIEYKYIIVGDKTYFVENRKESGKITEVLASDLVEADKQPKEKEKNVYKKGVTTKENVDKRQGEKLKEKTSEELFEDVSRKSFGVLTIELCQKWKNGYVKDVEEKRIDAKDVENLVKADIEWALNWAGEKEGKDFEKVVQYILEQLK